MKTKFYKRLVPLALIASMAVTNVGITSASANTPVAIEQTTGIDAPVVGAAADGLTSQPEFELNVTQAEFQYSSTAAASDEVTVDVATKDNMAATANGKLQLVDADGETIEGVSIGTITATNSIPVTVKRSVFNQMADGETIPVHFQWKHKVDDVDVWEDVIVSNSLVEFNIKKKTTFSKANATDGDSVTITSTDTSVLKYTKGSLNGSVATDGTAKASLTVKLSAPLTIDPSTLYLAKQTDVTSVTDALYINNSAVSITLDPSDDTSSTLNVEIEYHAAGSDGCKKFNPDENEVYTVYLIGKKTGDTGYKCLSEVPIKYTIEEAEPTVEVTNASYSVTKNTPVACYGIEGIGTADSTTKLCPRYGLFYYPVTKSGNDYVKDAGNKKLLAYVDKENMPGYQAAKAGTEAGITDETKKKNFNVAVATAVKNWFTTGTNGDAIVAAFASDNAVDKYVTDELVKIIWGAKGSIFDSGSKTVLEVDGETDKSYIEKATSDELIAAAKTVISGKLAALCGTSGDDYYKSKIVTAIKTANSNISSEGDTAVADEKKALAKAYLASLINTTTGDLSAFEAIVKGSAPSVATYTAKVADVKNTELLKTEYGGTVEDIDWENTTWLLTTTNAKGKETTTKFAKLCDKSGTLITKQDGLKGTATEKNTDGTNKTAGSAKDVFVTAESANGKFNGTAQIHFGAYSKTKSKTLGISKGAVVNETFKGNEFYVKPELSSEFKTVTAPKGVTWGTATTNDAAKGINVYTMEIAAGKSAKLPFSAKNGAEKDLAYQIIDTADNGTGFTLKDGKVTAYAANDTDFTAAGNIGIAQANLAAFQRAENTLNNVIKVYSRANPDLCAYVAVKVTPAVKSLRANATKIGMWPGATQEVSLGTNPATTPGSYYYEISGGTKYDLFDGDATTPLTDGKYVTSGVLVIKAKTGANATVEKDTIEVKLAKTDKTDAGLSKTLKIGISAIPAPQDVKSVKMSYKKDTVEIPYGGAVNSGFTVAPVGAPNDLDGSDVITGGKRSVELAGGLKKADTFKGATSKSYSVTEYKPNGSVAFDQTAANEYVVKGGFLMTKTAADTDCERVFKSGTTLYLGNTGIANGGDEDVIWTCNKSSAVRAYYDDTNSVNYTNASGAAATGESGLFLDLCQAGTYTITGTTKNSKQKYSFKINIEEDTAAKKKGLEAKTAMTVTESDGTVTTATDNSGDEEVDLKLKEKAYANIFTAIEGVGGKTLPTFTSGDAKVVKVDKSGNITAVGVGSTTISVTANGVSRKVTVNVAPELTLTKMTVPTGGIKGKEVKLAAGIKGFNKKTMTVVWEYRALTDTFDLGELDPDDGTVVMQDSPNDAKPDVTSTPKWTEITTLKNALSGKWTLPNTAGVYQVRVRVTNGKAEYVSKGYDQNDNTKTVLVANTDEFKCYSTGWECQTANADDTTYIKVYDNAIGGANVNNGDADTKKAIATLAKKPKSAEDEATKFNGVQPGHVYIPVFVTPEKGKTQDTVAAADIAAVGDPDADIVWTSSNHSLANVISFTPVASVDTDNYRNKEENDIIKNAKAAGAYGVAEIEVGDITLANKYTGIVNIKGTMKNSGKSFTIKLNVKEGTVLRESTAANFAVPFDPQDVVFAGAADETPVLATVEKATKANDTSAPLITEYDASNANNADLKKLQGIAQTKKLAVGKKITAWQYVLVNDSTVATVNKNLTTKAFLCDKAVVDQTAGTLTSIKANVAGGTYYLALAQVDYEVSKAYKAETKKADGTTDKAEEIAEFKAPVIKKVASIASKTPMIAATKVEFTQNAVGVFANVVNNDTTAGHYRVVPANTEKANYGTAAEVTLAAKAIADGKLKFTPTVTNDGTAAILVYSADGSTNWKSLGKYYITVKAAATT